MNWEEYKSDFRIKAENLGASNDAILKQLRYAKRLVDKDLPIIYDLKHFSLLVGYTETFLIGAVIFTKKYYREFSISKKNGDERIISEPLPSLKSIQRWILDNILSKCQVSSFAKAYIKNRSIKDNARFHKNQKNVLTIDIKDFFGFIHLDKVVSVFLSLGYNKQVSSLLGKLCCKDNKLPQGAPCSAALSNIVLLEFDQKLFNYCNPKKIRFTRYADDITFSYEETIITGSIILYTENLLLLNGFEINTEKTRLMQPHQRQEVTGIIVNNNKLRVPNNLRNNLRQIFYYIKKFGLDSHMEKINQTKGNYINHLLGLCNFVLFINPQDNEVRDYLRIGLEYKKGFESE